MVLCARVRAAFSFDPTCEERHSAPRRLGRQSNTGAGAESVAENFAKQKATFAGGLSC